MKIIQVKRIDESIYNLTYKTYFGRIKTAKIFPFLFGWRYCDTGKDLPYRIDVSVGNMAKNLKVNEVKTL